MPHYTQHASDATGQRSTVAELLNRRFIERVCAILHHTQLPIHGGTMRFAIQYGPNSKRHYSTAPRMNATTTRSMSSQDCPSGASASGCTVALGPSSAHKESRADVRLPHFTGSTKLGLREQLRNIKFTPTVLKPANQLRGCVTSPTRWPTSHNLIPRKSTLSRLSLTQSHSHKVQDPGSNHIAPNQTLCDMRLTSSRCIQQR